MQLGSYGGLLNYSLVYDVPPDNQERSLAARADVVVKVTEEHPHVPGAARSGRLHHLCALALVSRETVVRCAPPLTSSSSLLLLRVGLPWRWLTDS